MPRQQQMAVVVEVADERRLASGVEHALLDFGHRRRGLGRVDRDAHHLGPGFRQLHALLRRGRRVAGVRHRHALDHDGSAAAHLDAADADGNGAMQPNRHNSTILAAPEPLTDRPTASGTPDLPTCLTSGTRATCEDNISPDVGRALASPARGVGHRRRAPAVPAVVGRAGGRRPRAAAGLRCRTATSARATRGSAADEPALHRHLRLRQRPSRASARTRRECCAPPPGIYRSRPGHGHRARRLLQPAPRPDARRARRSTASTRCWRPGRSSTASWAARPEVDHVLVFENKGEVVGVSNPHPHCQIYATNFVFKTIETEAARRRAPPGGDRPRAVPGHPRRRAQRRPAHPRRERRRHRLRAVLRALRLRGLRRAEAHARASLPTSSDAERARPGRRCCATCWSGSTTCGRCRSPT